MCPAEAAIAAFETGRREQIELMDRYRGRLAARDRDLAVPAPSVEQRTAGACVPAASARHEEEIDNE